MKCTLMFRQKKTTVGYGLQAEKRHLDLVIGNRATASGMRLWDNKRDTNELLLYRYQESYNEIIPPEKRLQTQKETFTIEILTVESGLIQRDL